MAEESRVDELSQSFAAADEVERDGGTIDAEASMAKATRKVIKRTKTKAAAGEAAVLEAKTVKAWEQWLEKYYKEEAGVWLVLTKKSAGKGHVEYGEILDVALCYGWIDGLRKSKDAGTFLQKFTPRRKRSIWSKVNCAKAAALIEGGRMRAPGLAEVERAKADGRWDAAYDSWSEAKPPPDLEAALKGNAKAAAAFAGLDSRNRYAVIFRTQTAKRAETRAKRIAEFVAMLARGERIHP